MPVSKPSSPKSRKGLVAIIGVFATVLAIGMTTEEESGRKVKVEVVQGDQVKVTHVSGPQYLKTYLDIVGVATACDGLTGPHIDKARREGRVFTEFECMVLLEDELVGTASHVMACSSGLRADRVGYQRGASVVMAHNIGRAGWCGSTARKQLDAGQIVAAGDAMLAWNKGRFPASAIARRQAMGSKCSRSANGVWRCTIKGLTDRRHREREIFVTGQPGYPAATLKQRLARWK